MESLDYETASKEYILEQQNFWKQRIGYAPNWIAAPSFLTMYRNNMLLFDYHPGKYHFRGRQIHKEINLRFPQSQWDGSRSLAYFITYIKDESNRNTYRNPLFDDELYEVSEFYQNGLELKLFRESHFYDFEDALNRRVKTQYLHTCEETINAVRYKDESYINGIHSGETKRGSLNVTKKRAKVLLNIKPALFFPAVNHEEKTMLWNGPAAWPACDYEIINNETLKIWVSCNDTAPNFSDAVFEIYFPGVNLHDCIQKEYGNE